MPALPELLRALAVDEEKVIADDLAMICVSKGHAARAASSAEEAITMAQTLHHFAQTDCPSDILAFLNVCADGRKIVVAR